MTDREYLTYRTLLEVYRGGYSNIKLDEALRTVRDEKDRAYITQLFYGVLTWDGRLEYAIKALCAKKPKPNVAVLLKVGMYMLSFMRVPDYAAIDKTVELSKKIGKVGVSGFINATLRRYSRFVYPDRGEVDDATFLSIASGVPQWVADMLLRDHGYDLTYDMLTACVCPDTHIRRNENQIAVDALEEKLKKCNDLRPDACKLGYYVTHNTMSMLNRCDFTAQSLSSMLAVRYYLAALGKENARVLDVCAAPGGKSVYMAGMGYDVTAGDLHPHRVQLIRQYADRMGARVNAMENDACVLREEWKNQYDLVVCDVPCSGIGVRLAKPDIVLNRTPQDVAALPKLQLCILRTSAAYVQPDGVLCYSTCTVTKAENDGVVQAFLADGDFELYTPSFGYGYVSDGALRLYPQDGMDGFFVAAFRRKKAVL